MDEDRRPVEDGGSDTLKSHDVEIARALGTGTARLPRSVRRSLECCAAQWLDRHPGSPPGASTESVELPPILLRRRTPWFAWAIATAALGLALIAWWPRLIEPTTESSVDDFGQWRANVARRHMLSHVPGVGHWRWASDAGDVVWDRQRQRGYLLLRGFVANDPAQARYQLWIFDGARDERYPVDGGLFDVPPGRAEVVIPVKATLPVVRPTAFAVTVEEPGGAVVSLREKIVAFARAEG